MGELISDQEVVSTTDKPLVETPDGRLEKPDHKTVGEEAEHDDFRVIEVYQFFGLNPQDIIEEDLQDVKTIFNWLRVQEDTGLGFVWPLRRMSSDMGTDSNSSQHARIAARLRLEAQLKQNIKELSSI